MKKQILILITAFALWAVPTRLLAWGCEGHQVVAYIAERELNPVALSNAVSLLTAVAIDIHRNCTAPAGTTPMSDAATWADDIRNYRKDTAAWHFVDVPLNHAGEDPTKWCNDDCVIKALNDQMDILREADLKNPDPKTVEALRYVIHFVGDVHQPLHATTNSDRGGNCDPLIFEKHKPHARGTSYSPELHGIWDTEMVEELGAGSAADDAVALAQLLDREITDEERKSWASQGPTEWAIESTKAAAAAVYQGLTDAKGHPVEPAKLAGTEVKDACSAAAEKRLVTMGLTAGADYRSAGEAVIEERLKQAGVRLAFLLNSLWPDDDMTSSHAALHEARHPKNK